MKKKLLLVSVVLTAVSFAAVGWKWEHHGAAEAGWTWDENVATWVYTEDGA